MEKILLPIRGGGYIGAAGRRFTVLAVGKESDKDALVVAWEQPEINEAAISVLQMDRWPTFTANQAPVFIRELKTIDFTGILSNISSPLYGVMVRISLNENNEILISEKTVEPPFDVGGAGGAVGSAAGGAAGQANRVDKETPAGKLLVWIERNRKRSFSARDCFSSLRSSFRRMDDINVALVVLIEHDYIGIKQQPKGMRGRPRREFIVNRCIVKKWEKEAKKEAVELSYATIPGAVYETSFKPKNTLICYRNFRHRLLFVCKRYGMDVVAKAELDQQGKTSELSYSSLSLWLFMHKGRRPISINELNEADYIGVFSAPVKIDPLNGCKVCFSLGEKGELLIRNMCLAS